MSETAEQPLNEQAVAELPSPPKPKRKRRKRPAGAGSFYQRPDGLWMGRVCLGKDADGKPIRPSRYGETRREVKEVCARERREYEKQRAAKTSSAVRAVPDSVSISGQESHGMVISSTGAMTIQMHGGMIITVDAGAAINVHNAIAQ
jgi:hypothetical protein